MEENKQGDHYSEVNELLTLCNSCKQLNLCNISLLIGPNPDIWSLIGLDPDIWSLIGPNPDGWSLVLGQKCINLGQKHINLWQKRNNLGQKRRNSS